MSTFSFQKFESSLEVLRTKTNFSDNFGNNEFYNISIQVQFITSKTKLDIQYSKTVIQYRKLPHYLSNKLRLNDVRLKNNLKFGWKHNLVSSLHSGNQTLAIAVKKHAKVDAKLFFSCPILLDFFILFQMFRSILEVNTVLHFLPYTMALRQVSQSKYR